MDKNINKFSDTGMENQTFYQLFQTVQILTKQYYLKCPFQQKRF